MKNSIRIPLLVIALACLLFATVLSASSESYAKYSHMFFGTFDTPVDIVGFATDREIFNRNAAMAETMFNKYHKLFDRYHPYEGVNNVYTLNQDAKDGPVLVEQPLFDLIQFSKEHATLTKNNVNIAMGSVLKLWHDARDLAEINPDQAAIPSMEALQEAEKHTALEDVILDAKNNTVYFKDPLLQLDLGAVAKGYAAELVAQELLKGDMPHFIINAGGNVRAGLGPMDGRKNWGVGIQDPNGNPLMAGQNVLDVLFLHDLSVVTSGDYQRYFVVDGQVYHHLISPFTLMPPRFMRSVTIITRDSGLADLLSTAVFLMPVEEGQAFVASQEGVEAIWVLNDDTTVMTPGAEQYAKSKGATN